MPFVRQRVYLIRHGETQWSLSRQHTGLTDIPLTENGRAIARRLARVLAERSFELVLVSPLERARETCELAGLGQRSTVTEDLCEWNYGEYEGLTPQQIRVREPEWLIFRDGCPGGESPEQIGVRVDRVITRVRSVEGDVPSLRTATCCGYSPLAGSVSRYLTAATSSSILPRSACSATTMEPASLNDGTLPSSTDM